MKTNEDTISIASTATIQDSIHINFNNPRLLGKKLFLPKILIKIFFYGDLKKKN